MHAQPDLFGEPERKPELSQLFTPLWLARRMARRWVRREWHVLEPSVGRGNLVRGLLDAGHFAQRITGIDIDGRWVDFCRAEFEGRVHFMEGNFLRWLPHRTYDCVQMNPPWEDNLHMEFALRALELAPHVNMVVPASFEFSEARDSKLFQARAVVNRRAILPYRVKFDGKGGFDTDCVALQLGRRGNRRRVGEERMVFEETWLPDDDVSEAA